jgi:hypothetical protein
MANRRKHKRKKARVQVGYGEDEITERGFARDISLGGMFLDCRRPPAVGTRLHLHLRYPDRDFYMEAVVVRQKIVNPQLRQIEKQGVGLRFLTPTELIEGAVPKKDRVRQTNVVQCSDEAAVRDLLDKQLSARVIAVPVADPPPGQGDIVEFSITVGIGDGSNIDGRGRVVQLIGTGDAQQAVLEVQDADKVRQSLEEAIG